HKESELNLLISQLSPHFLFNTLCPEPLNVSQ
ncbi:MAG: histidine kinase, partial [Cytophagaceae bacterium]